MVGFVFGIIFVIVFLAFMLIGRVGPEDVNFNLRYVAVIPLLIAALLFFIGMFTSIGAREVGVPINQGHLSTPLTSGWHLVAPWTNVITCPLSEEYDIQNADPRSGSALYNQSVPVAGSDGGSATADVTTAYHIDAKDVDRAYQLYKCDLSRIQDYAVAQRVRSDVAQAATLYVSTDLRANRAGIEKGALALLQSELAPQGITVDSVTLADMQLSSQAQTAADNKVAATNNLGVATIKNQQAQIDKNTALINADAEKAANSAKAVSLTGPVLCEQWIQAIATGHVSVINTAGPCGASGAGANTSVILPAPNG
jgi:hypothetical protein